MFFSDLQSLWITSLCSSDVKTPTNQRQLCAPQQQQRRQQQQQLQPKQTERSPQRLHKDQFALEQNLSAINSDVICQQRQYHCNQPQPPFTVSGSQSWRRQQEHAKKIKHDACGRGCAEYRGISETQFIGTSTDLQSLWITSLCSSDVKTPTNQRQLCAPHQQQRRQQQQQLQPKQTERSPQRLHKDQFALEQNLSAINSDVICQQRQYHCNQPQPPFTVSGSQSWRRQQEHAKKIKHDACGRGCAEYRGISETQFIGTSTDNVMDDMVFQYNNQNSIYVLNSNYTSYGNFPRLSFVDPVASAFGAPAPPTATANDRDGNYHRSSSTTASGRVCSTVGRSLQHKLKTLGNFSGTDTEAIGNSEASSTSSAACLPAAAAIQKLFTCSSAANTYTQCNSDRGCLLGRASAAATQTPTAAAAAAAAAERDNEVLRSGAAAAGGYNGNSIIVAGGGGGSGSVSGTSSSDGNKKKCANIKSNIIAKKTKFLKFLEEEKWRTSEDSSENFNATTSRSSSERRTNSNTSSSDHSCVSRMSPDAQEPTTFGRSVPHKAAPSNSNEHYSTNKATSSATEQQEQQKSNNWSGSHDRNGRQQQQQQQQQQLQLKEKQKSSYELYQEAAELLGLSCSLCDNCRCMDCQSGYFDCDDSDSCSEFSLMDEFDDDIAVASAAEQMMHADNFDSTTTAYGHHQPQPSQHEQQHEEEEQQEQYHTHNEWCTDCSNCTLSDDRVAAEDRVGATARAVIERHANECATPGESDICQRSERSLASLRRDGRHDSDDPLAATSSRNELENCSNFNELSLVDIAPPLNDGKAALK